MNHVLDNSPDPRRRRAIFGVVGPIEKYWGVIAAEYADMPEPIEMLFGAD